MKIDWYEVIIIIGVANAIWFITGQVFDQQTGFLTGVAYLSGYAARVLVEWDRAKNASSGRPPASGR